MNVSTICLSGRWLHHTGDPAGAGSPGFDDRHWQAVDIPHTWNAIDATSGGDRAGKNRTGYRRGPGWYRLRFAVGSTGQGRRHFLRFEGASQTAAVFVNGRHAGGHAGAFTAFCLEISDYVHAGENLLAVRVDNSWDAHIPPLEGDFVVFGGLYRPVHLISTDALCVDRVTHGGPGIYAIARDISLDAASLEVRTLVSNAAGSGADSTIRIALFDATGNLVANSTESLPPGARESRQSIAVVRPRLWQGTVDPYLYRIRAEIRSGESLVDAVEVSFGFRTFGFDVEGRFLLNGHPHRIAGVNRHQDRESKGWALSDRDHEEDMALLREIGANAVRLAHYPHADRFYDLCDRFGLLVWAEIPLVNLVDDSPEFSHNCHRQLTELVHQQFNRAGIFTWGIWNELGMSEGPDPEPLVRSLHELARSADPTRATVGAAFGLSHRRHPEILAITDQIAWNEYPGWYGEQPPASLGDALDRLQRRVPGKGLAVSEYGAGASVNHHTQDLSKAPSPDGRWHPEEWQAFVHEETWREISRRPFVWGSFVWNLCDFASAMRAEGDRDGINDKGLVTFDRAVRKDAFHFYKAAWSGGPVLYIASRRHADRSEPQTPIKIYCNQDRVELRVNGTKIPMSSRDGVICRWDRVGLRPGANEIVAIAQTTEGATLRDSCNWTLTLPATGSPSAIPASSTEP